MKINRYHSIAVARRNATPNRIVRNHQPLKSTLYPWRRARSASIIVALLASRKIVGRIGTSSTCAGYEIWRCSQEPPALEEYAVPLAQGALRQHNRGTTGEQKDRGQNWYFEHLRRIRDLEM